MEAASNSSVTYLFCYSMYSSELEKSVIENILDLLHSHLDHILNCYFSIIHNMEEQNENIDSCYNDNFSDLESEMEKKSIDNHDKYLQSYGNELSSIEKILGDSLVLVRKVIYNKTVRSFIVFQYRDILYIIR